MSQFVSTGVDGLDTILGGGITPQSTVLVSGTPGTGKSLLGIQYLYAGVSESDERGVYVSFEEDAEDVREAAESIGFEAFGEFVDDSRIVILDKRDLLKDDDLSAMIDRILETISDQDFDRLVLDSLSMFKLFFADEREERTYLLKFSDILKESGLTSLLIHEQATTFPDTEIGLENFLTDGNIHLIQTPTGSGVSRYLWVAKMRKQDIDTDIYPLEIDEGGLVVHDQAGGFTMVDHSGTPF